MKRPLMWICVLTIFISILRFNLCITEPPPNLQRTEPIALQGRVASYEIRNGQTILYLSDVLFYGESAKEIANNNSIGVCCYLDNATDCKLGQTVAVQGFLTLPESARNPGGFDAVMYYGGKGYDYLLYEGKMIACGRTYDFVLEWLNAVSQYGKRQLDTYLQENDAGMMKAMMLGDKSGIDNSSKALYQESGIYHILAISGLHISLLGGCLYKLLRVLRIKAWPAAVISFMVIILYGIMIGMSPSAFRAIIMYGFTLTALLAGRSHDRMTSLAVAAACLIGSNPMLFFDAGVRLSFLAVLGIVCLYPTFVGAHKFHMKFADGVWVSFAVTYMTLPVIMQTFYGIPVYSLLINICVIPFVPVLIVLGILIILLGNWGGALVQGSVWGIHFILNFYEKLLLFFRAIPGNYYVTGAPGEGQVVVFYVGLGAMIFIILRIKRRLLIRSLKSEGAYWEGNQKFYADEQKKIRKCMIYMRVAQVVTMTALFIMLIIKEPFDCRITFLDVGQGDGICIETEEQVYLIDCGSTSEAQIGKYTLIPFLEYRGIQQIDGWFLTHPDSDHVSGFIELCKTEDMGGIKVENLCIPRVLQSEFGELIRLAESRGIDVMMLEQGDRIETNNFRMIAMSPTEEAFYPDENAASLVLYWECNGFNGLFMGDASVAAEKAIMETEIQDITMLKVAHHGSCIDTNSKEFIDCMSPEAAVISCGANNMYGHPHKEVIERLEKEHCRIYVTSEFGAIVFKIGRNAKISSME